MCISGVSVILCTCVEVGGYTCLYLCMCIRVEDGGGPGVCVCVFACMHTCVFVCVYVCVCVCV